MWVENLVTRAYWALAINSLEPVDPEEVYTQEDIEELVDELREFLHG